MSGGSKLKALTAAALFAALSMPVVAHAQNNGGGGGGFYYVGAGRTVPSVGSPVSGGSPTPEAGVTYTDAAHSFSIARGGFGGTAGDGHGGGEGGGHGGGGGE